MQDGKILEAAITHAPYHYIRIIRIIPLNMNHILMCRARLREQNEGTRNIIRSLHKAMDVDRVPWLGMTPTVKQTSVQASICA